MVKMVIVKCFLRGLNKKIFLLVSFAFIFTSCFDSKSCRQRRELLFVDKLIPPFDFLMIFFVLY